MNTVVILILHATRSHHCQFIRNMFETIKYHFDFSGVFLLLQFTNRIFLFQERRRIVGIALAL